MWVLATILALALVLRAGPVRGLVRSESAVAFGFSFVAVVVLFQIDRLG